MENVLFKISFPAEFHAQTAVECAIQLHEEVKNRLDQIERVRSLPRSRQSASSTRPDRCTIPRTATIVSST